MTKEKIKEILKDSVSNNDEVYVLCNCGGYTAHFSLNEHNNEINICDDHGIRVISIYNHNECHITNEGKKSLDMAMLVTIMEQFRLPVRLSSHYTHSGYAVDSAEEIDQYAKLFSFSDRVKAAYALWQEVKPDERDKTYLGVISCYTEVNYLYNSNDGDWYIDNALQDLADAEAEYKKNGKSDSEKAIDALGIRYPHEFYGKVWSLCLRGKDWRKEVK